MTVASDGAHPAYYDVPAWNADGSMFMYMRHVDDDNRDDCYIADAAALEMALNGGEAVNARGARNVGCVWSDAHADLAWYLHYDEESTSCLRAIDLQDPNAPVDEEVRCYDAKMQMAPTFAQFSATAPGYAGWVLLVPTDIASQADNQFAVVLDADGNEPLHFPSVVPLDELVRACDQYGPEDLVLEEAGCSPNSCGFVHRVRYMNYADKNGPHLFASNGVDNYRIRVSEEGEWVSERLEHDGEHLRCVGHPMISRDGRFLSYVDKGLPNVSDTSIRVASLGETAVIGQDSFRTHPWSRGSGTHPSFRFVDQGDELIADARSAANNDNGTNGMLFVIRWSPDGDSDEEVLVAHDSYLDENAQPSHPHPTVDATGELVAFGTDFGAVLAPDEPECCSTRVFRMPEPTIKRAVEER